MELKNVSKSFYVNNKNIDVLQNINYKFEPGLFYAIMGESGNGKTTLINILGLLENVTSGKYLIANQDVTHLNDKETALLRRDYIGFVFQDFNLDDNLKAYENVMVPMLINKNINNPKKQAINILQELGLEDRLEHYPKQLSGGEQQRVAIARALANNPKVILADEPTGNLDSENEKKIFQILKKLSKDGKCVIVVSHSNTIKKYADIVLKISKGKLSDNHGK